MKVLGIRYCTVSKQAEAIALAQQIGKLSLSLRSLADEETVLAEDLPQLRQGVNQLKQEVSLLSQEAVDPMQPLDVQDDLSLTTDMQVNFLLQKVLRHIPAGGGEKTSRQVQVHRGGDTVTRDFK